jgi:hypothetical protein
VGLAVRADGRIYLGDEDGDVEVLKTGRPRRSWAPNNMGISVYSTPVAKERRALRPGPQSPLRAAGRSDGQAGHPAADGTDGAARTVIKKKKMLRALSWTVILLAGAADGDGAAARASGGRLAAVGVARTATSRRRPRGWPRPGPSPPARARSGAVRSGDATPAIAESGGTTLNSSPPPGQKACSGRWLRRYLAGGRPRRGRGGPGRRHRTGRYGRRLRATALSGMNMGVRSGAALHAAREGRFRLRGGAPRRKTPCPGPEDGPRGLVATDLHRRVRRPHARPAATPAAPSRTATPVIVHRGGSAKAVMAFGAKGRPRGLAGPRLRPRLLLADAHQRGRPGPAGGLHTDGIAGVDPKGGPALLEPCAPHASTAEHQHAGLGRRQPALHVLRLHRRAAVSCTFPRPTAAPRSRSGGSRRRCASTSGPPFASGTASTARAATSAPAFVIAIDVRTGDVAWQERGFARANSSPPTGS